MRIVLATGGSGGHIFPALKTAQRLKSEGHEVLLVGALRFAEERLKQAGLAFVILDVEGFNAKTPAAVVSFASLMLKAVLRSLRVLRSFKPQVVAGFGSYSSFPVVFAAWLSRIPTLVHEQNVVPGKANRWSFRFARRVALTFQDTEPYVPPGREVVWTGCPCNSERSPESRTNLLGRFHLQPKRLTVLVLGGSQGSRYLNEIFFEAIPYLQAERDIQVIHMTGRTDYSLYAEKYLHLNIPYHVCSFLDNIQDAYSVADLVVGRAGAGTVCEIAAFELPSVLVPYPFAHGHQAANAKVLEKAGVAVVIEQKDLTRPKLVEAVGRLAREGITPSVVRERVADLFMFNAAGRLAEAVVSLKK
jgi:UDP-N-acetylglucosamine--N-acetylmuramyl-(pentapeptide) pyrophosphoryl-undecaprenol N-acetylglucosamine transferase